MKMIFENENEKKEESGQWTERNIYLNKKK